MQNTFWTLIDDEYYRIHNGVLKYAPVCSETNKVVANEESLVQVISAYRLENINKILGSKFTVDDFS